MDIVIMIAQLILSLSILVVLHELGHFIPAKLFGTRVEKFYLFFAPWFAIFKRKIGDTEYGIGWLPLGGYVKISGMVDESMDKSFTNQKPQPWEFRSKKAWQRLIIMIGGVMVNFLLGFIIFAGMFWTYGESYIPNESLKYGIVVDSISKKIGFQNGDQLISCGGKPITEFNTRAIVKSIILDNVKQIEINREGNTVTVPITPEVYRFLTDHQKESLNMFTPRIPVEVLEVPKNSAASQSGLKKDDKILAINGGSIEFIDQLKEKLQQNKNNKIDLTILRNGENVELKQIEVSKDGTIGFSSYGIAKYIEVKTKEYSLIEALPAGVSRGLQLIQDQLSGFKKMFTGEIDPSKSLGGFASITKLFAPTWDWQLFWLNTAILSLILGFMNLLPIPALDGGYIMFLIWEVITGKKVSDKVMEYSTTVGIILLMGLMLYANGLDIMRGLN